MNTWSALLEFIVLSLVGLLAVILLLWLVEVLKAFGWLKNNDRRFSNSELLVLTVAAAVSTWLAIEVLQAGMINHQQ
jgi:hypothetical protein